VDWNNCIVSLIDLVGIKDLATQGGSAASALMRRLHVTILQKMDTGLPTLAHAYIWNDCVLLLAYLDGTKGGTEAVLRDIDGLKRNVDALADSYAIAVQGQSFPDPSANPGSRALRRGEERVTFLRASSYAMANCFTIEKVLGRKMKKPWYVDSRIARRLRTPCDYKLRNVRLLPSGRERSIYVYEDYLW